MSNSSFTFDINSNDTQRALRRGETVLVDLIRGIYDCDQIERSEVVKAEMLIYAYGSFQGRLSQGTEFWMALTGATTALLDEYPLNGYAPTQIGFGGIIL